MPRETVKIKARDSVTLYGDLFEQAEPKATIIMFHGYRSSGRYDFSCAASVADQAKNHEKITVLTNTIMEEVSGENGIVGDCDITADAGIVTDMDECHEQSVVTNGNGNSHLFPTLSERLQPEPMPVANTMPTELTTTVPSRMNSS